MKKFNLLHSILCSSILAFLSVFPVLAEKGKSGYAASVPKPTIINIQYGENRRNVLDLWIAPSETPTPLVMVIHGGGWNGGSKEIIDRFVDTKKLLDAGISVASINYRLIKHAKDLDPPVKGPMSDSARALQFIRSKASEWNIDKSKIAASGGSAGGCTSLWLAYHDDLADPKSEDLVSRESTRLTCVAVTRPQTTLDPKQMKQWISNSKYGGHAFGVKDFNDFLVKRPELLAKINEYSPYSLLTKDAPQTYLHFTKAPSKNKHEKDPTHSSIFGIKLKERCDILNVPCEVVYPGAKNIEHETVTSYLIDTLLAQDK